MSFLHVVNEHHSVVLSQRGAYTLYRSPSLDPPFDDEGVGKATFSRSENPRFLYRPLPLSGADDSFPDVLHQDSAPSFPPDNPVPLFEPGTSAYRIAHATLEVLAGLRPHLHLKPLFLDAAYSRLGTKLSTKDHRCRLKCPSIAAMRMCEPCNGVVEAALVAREGEISYAITMRLENVDGQWLCAVFEIV